MSPGDLYGRPGPLWTPCPELAAISQADVHLWTAHRPISIMLLGSGLIPLCPKSHEGFRDPGATGRSATPAAPFEPNLDTRTSSGPGVCRAFFQVFVEIGIGFRAKRKDM